MNYEERVVAYIDILGFKSAIEKSNDDEKEFNRILGTLNEIKRFFIDSHLKSKEINEFLNADTQIVQVSDSLIISRLAHESGGIYSLIRDCSFAVHLLISNGFLCRGAIKVGNMYHNGNTLFGDAFVKAYQAESQEHLPIIKFDSNLLEIAKDYPLPANIGYRDWEVNEIKPYIKELMTGIHYLDYFTDYDYWVGGDEGSASKHYYELRKILVNGLKNSNNPNIYEKYRWAADQFNKTAENYRLDKII